jgi:hypothetical protein
METHDQTWVKVNAPVDTGISGLVSALSTFPSLETIESCEGHEGQAAWVSFRYGTYWQNPWHDLADFVLAYLVPKLASLVGDDATVRIQGTPSGQIFGELSVRPGAALRVEVALRQLARDFSVHPRRSSGCCDGTSGTSPERC